MKLLASIVDDDDYFESFDDLFDTRNVAKATRDQCNRAATEIDLGCISLLF